MVEEAWEDQQRRAREDLSEFAARELSPFRVHALVLEGDPATAIEQGALRTCRPDHDGHARLWPLLAFRPRFSHGNSSAICR